MKQKIQSKRKLRTPKTILRLPDLDVAKSAVLNSLSSPDAQRGHRHAIDEFVDWYCSEPRLSFSKTVVVRYRMHLESRKLAPGTINLRLGAVRRLAYEAADFWTAQRRFGSRHSTGQGQSAGITTGSLFRRVSSADRVWGESVTEKLVWHVVKEFAAKIGVIKLAPHDLRRSCARLCRASGGELEQFSSCLVTCPSGLLNGTLAAPSESHRR